MNKQKTFHAETPRTNIVTVRFSDDEMETLDFVCQVLDQSRSQYIRRKALTGGIPRPEVRIALDEERASAVAGQLGRIGNNLNQIARKLNSGDKQTNRMTDDIARTIDQLNERLRFLRDVEDFRGNSETNRNYHDFITYVLFQHDSHARPIYDHNHVKRLRENYLIDAINTTPWTYNLDCQRSNRQWKKNREEREVKQHHFILSFDPKDVECGLTMEKAQALGMEFARKHFSGHQCVVATHDDGNNHSGNIHTHISINSLRTIDTEPPEYSNLARDYKAGFKFQAQVELNRKAKQNVTDKEYWASQRGQERLGQKNEAIRSVGGKPTESKFKTELARIRIAINETKQKCSSVEDFKAILKREHNITVTESRGRWSYLPEYRKRPITSRRLGDDYGKEAIEAFINQRLLELQQQQAAEQAPQAVPEQKAEKKPASEPKQASPIIETVVTGRIIDLNDPKIKASYGLTQWAKIQNLKAMSMSFNYLTENHLLNLDDLQATIEDHKQDFNHDTQRLLRVEKNLKECNGLLKHLGLYHKYRPLYEQYLKTHKSPKFREKNIRELLLYDGAVKYLREYQQAHHVNSVPNYQSLKEAKVRLTAQQQELYERRRRLKDTIKTMEDGYKLLEQLEPKRSQPNLHRYHQLE